MEEPSIDLRRMEIHKIGKDIPIPRNTKSLLVSSNSLKEIDKEILSSLYTLEYLDLNRNLISNCNFLNVFQCLKYLDLRNNQISLESLISIQNLHLIHIRLNDNPCMKSTFNYPFLIPAILKNIWIFDGIFYTDSQRKQILNYSNSPQFGDDFMNIIHSNNIPYSSMPFHSSVQSARIFIKRIVEQQSINEQIIPFSCKTFSQNYNPPQFKRLNYLSSFNSFPFFDFDSHYSFSELMGISLGFISYFWLNTSYDVIPHLLCSRFWFSICNDISKLEHYEKMVFLYQIVQKMISLTDFNEKIYKISKIKDFLEKGIIPPLGSSARLLVAGLFTRGIIEMSIAPNDIPSDDIKSYLYFRKAFGYSTLNIDISLQEMYFELTNPLNDNISIYPNKGDSINVINPITNNFEVGHISKVQNGRIYSKLDKSNIIVQIPITSIFWENEGIWKEGIKTNKKIYPVREPSTPRNTFITASKKFKSFDTDVINEPKREISPFFKSVENENLSTSLFENIEKTPKIYNRIPDDQDHDKILQITRNSFRTDTYSFQISPRKNKNFNFRGILVPNFQSPVRRSHRNHKIVNSVKDVLNIGYNGPMKDEGSPYRRFYVRKINPFTSVSKFQIEKEEDIDNTDVDQLVKLFNVKQEKMLTCQALII